MQVSSGQSQFTPPLLVVAPISMGTGQLVGIVALSLITLGLAAGVNRLVQNYRFRAAIMKGGGKEMEVAKSALRWGASNWLYNRDLLTLGKNSKPEQLTFLFAQQSYSQRLHHVNRCYPSFEDAWAGRGGLPVCENEVFENIFQAFRKASAEQLACTMLLQSYLTIRPLKNCTINYTYIGDKISQALLRIFSDAVKNKEYPMAKIFLDKGLEVQNCIFWGQHIVFRDLSIESLQFWLDNGLDPNISGLGNNTLLTACITNHEVASVRLLLERGATNIDAQNSSEKTALMAAVSTDDVDIARILLENKANPNLGNPLQIASLRKNESMCLLLIEKKAILTQTARDTTLAQTGDANWVDRLWKVYSNSSQYLDAFFKP